MHTEAKSKELGGTLKQKHSETVTENLLNMGIVYAKIFDQKH